MKKIRKFPKVSLLSLMLLFVVFTSIPSPASAAVIFSDSFGSSDTYDVPGWVDGGGDEFSDSQVENTSSRAGSPTSHHARVGDGGHITRTISTTGYQNIVLKYYWRGDNDADGSSDNLKVYWKKTSDGTFLLLNTHQMDNNEVWSSQVSVTLPASANNTSIDIRFLGDSNDDDDEEGRVDDVSLEGESLVTDEDGDEVADSEDNCPLVSNADQTDTDGDETGDACDDTPNGLGSIVITKYECEFGTEVTRSQNGVVGETSVPEDCVLQSGASFGYVHGEQEDANGPYPELSAELTSLGSTGEDGVLTISDLPADGRYLIVETDEEGEKLPYPGSVLLGLYCEGDGDTSDNNDNQELTFVPMNGSANCVAYNEAPEVITPQCSNDGDDDEDDMTDANDPGCHTDSNVNNSESYDGEDNDESNDNENPACSDGMNNDEEDELVDSNDPGCHEDGDAGNSESWLPEKDSEEDPKKEEDPVCSDGVDNDEDGNIDYPDDRGCKNAQDEDETNTPGPSSEGTISGSTRGSTGEVLGAETSCEPYMDTSVFLKKDYPGNRADQVIKVQQFLLDYLNINTFAVDGVFGEGTEVAVKQFQSMSPHNERILKPWGLTEPTGIVYKTTTTEINNVMCPELDLPIPTDLVPWGGQ